MRRKNLNSFARHCQRGLFLTFAACVLAAAAARADQGLGVSTSQLLGVNPAPPATPYNPDVLDLLARLSRMHVGGSMSFNWREIGPREPGFEAQIQDEVYLSDMYFGVDGPFVKGIPLDLEFNIPTESQGVPQLYQLNFAYKRIENWTFQFGKFLVPFGRYNELYRPDQFLTVTRPLLYASPDSLDLVIRNNSPRPPVTAGYTDIGARVSYYPKTDLIVVPDELTFYVVNGLGEEANRTRAFPNSDALGIPPIPGNGTTIDFGHLDNNLEANHNSKAVGGRMVWALGDVRFPWPIPEGASDLKGVNVGLSGTGGQYDLEQNCNYQIWGGDVSFDYLGFNISGEYEYAYTEFEAPIDVNPSTLTNLGTSAPIGLGRSWDVNRGYFVQASYPILRHPIIGDRLTGVLVLNQMWRRGPNLDLFLNQTIDDTFYESVSALDPEGGRVTTRMEKYTAALNYKLSSHFWLKGEYSYWVMGNASTRSETSLGLVDIYQTAFAMVAAF